MPASRRAVTATAVVAMLGAGVPSNAGPAACSATFRSSSLAQANASGHGIPVAASPASLRLTSSAASSDR